MKVSKSFPNIGNYNVFNTIDNNYIIKKINLVIQIYSIIDCFSFLFVYNTSKYYIIYLLISTIIAFYGFIKIKYNMLKYLFLSHIVIKFTLSVSFYLYIFANINIYKISLSNLINFTFFIFDIMYLIILNFFIK